MATKIRITKTPIDDPKKKTTTTVTASPKGLTYDQINRWSDYVDAHPGGTFDDLFAGFSAAHKGHGIDPNVLKSELEKLKINSIKMGTQTGSDLGGAIHTGYSFPKMVVNGKNMGRINSDLKTEMSEPPQPFRGATVSKILPDGTEEAWFDPKENMVKYKDPHTGDIMYADRINLNHPLVRASMAKQNTDVTQRQNAIASISPNSILPNR